MIWSDRMSRTVLVWGGAGIACGAWVSMVSYFGALVWGQLASIALAMAPIVFLVSLGVVGLFVEGSLSLTSLGIPVALAYILLANVAIVLNPLHFFANYGAASTLYQRAAGAIVAVPMFMLAVLTAAAFAARRDLRAAIRPFEAWLIVFCVGTTLLSFGVGLAHSNFGPYIVSDLAKDLILPATWIVFRYAGRFMTSWRLLKLVIWFALLPPLVDIAYHLLDLLLDNRYERYGGYTALPLTFFVASMAFHATSGLRISVALGTATMLLGSLLSFSRVTWLQASATVVAGLWTGARAKKGAALAITTAVIVVIGVLLASGTSFRELIGDRLVELFSSQESEFVGIGGEISVGGLSGARKLTETYSVLAEFVSGGMGEWIVGFGEGAEFEHLAPSIEVQQIYEFRGLKIHNIHNIIAAVLFRKGIVGVLFLTILLVTFWRELRRIGRSKLSPEQRITLWTIKVFYVLSVLKSMSVDVILGALEWGALFAILGSLSNEVLRLSPTIAGGAMPTGTTWDNVKQVRTVDDD